MRHKGQWVIAMRHPNVGRQDYVPGKSRNVDSGQRSHPSKGRIASRCVERQKTQTGPA